MLKRAILFLLLQLFIFSSFAQNKRYTQNIANSKDSSIITSIIKLFKGKPSAFIDSTYLILNKTINNLSDQEGKRINSINIASTHFGTNDFSDTTIKQNILSKIANKLHNKTNDKTIRKNLFFHENEYMNPLLIAYNEKWLRDLSFIQDARIIVSPVLNDSNSVDVVVLTKDIFPFGASLQFKNINAYDASGTIENMNDNGNAFTVYHNFDINRTNKSGWGAGYFARNILGSFLDLNIGANSLENNYANFESTASNIYLKGRLPLLNPLSKWTGGFEWSHAQNNNEYPGKWTDSFYNATLKYDRKNFDSWVGYQLFNKPWKSNNNTYRHFIQYRFLDTKFFERPDNYLFQIDRNYQNVKANLFSFTLFKQQITRTQYLYGFGRNEDLPIGKSIVVTTGHYQREGSKLPYLGFLYESYQLKNNGKFIHLFLNTGTSYLDKQILDFKLLASIEQISKLHYLQSGYKYRSMLNISFAQTLKNKFNDALFINSIYGIPQLTKERINGGTRLTANWESIWYNSRSFYGFRQSPFVFANVTYIRTVGDPIKSGDIFSSIGGGTRVRNESLIFGTVEIKGFYFPRTHLQVSPWNLSIITNLRFKYNSNLISKPDFVQVN